MSITRRATVYYADATHGQFPLPFDGEFSNETLQVSPDGSTAVLGMLCAGSDAEDPFDGEKGDFYQFDHGRKHDTTRPELDDFKRIVRANPGRVFTVDACGDGFDVGSLVTPAMCRGKYQGRDYCEAEALLDNADGYYIAPEDATDPAEYAEGVLEQYSMWCNGEVFGVLVYQYHSIEGYDGLWELDNRDNECWGYIGEEYAAEELASQMEAV